MIGIAYYTYRRKNFGTITYPLLEGQRERWYAIVGGALAGFYDGFFGPGTGSFLIFIFVRIFGLDFLTATASA